MPRPTTKQALLDLSRENYNKLNALIDSLSPAEQKGTYPFEHRDKNIRDTIAHLHEWHLMFLAWYKVGMKGDKPDIPAKGYTWKTLPDLNQIIWQKYQSVGLADIRKEFKSSYDKVRRCIQKHSDEELFEKKRYKWTGTTSLGAYMISATSSHYDWAMTWLKKYQKSLG
ncbi:ClbS/DfsB family four-helix bundle protein [Teredinibacter sp. KSP-S5-2]|uniref:ClbS/DfsB family four-helix bundle protein n=1 Tax=Teredinibacter sp. KSP-S5-2 TaxID=3034506 RepID=UPI0029344E0E|nr:ClbS/DfsB family four-helix bundle protein [Teredinibacter sp. KSP-S5-2]WNO08726.1 ClbS/DfsB family four-helix bundle protein [Teredinibacter sp. KSP-S5-2]